MIILGKRLARTNKDNKKPQLFNLVFVEGEMNSNPKVFIWGKELLSPVTVLSSKNWRRLEGKEKSSMKIAILKLDTCKGLHETTKQKIFPDIETKGIYLVGIRHVITMC